MGLCRERDRDRETQRERDRDRDSNTEQQRDGNGVEKLIPEGTASRYRGPKLRECGKHGEQ
jgi:hypothetical protein